MGHNSETAGAGKAATRMLRHHIIGLPSTVASLPSLVVVLTCLAVYVAVCRLLRFRRVAAMHRQFDHVYTDRASLAAMTTNDAQAIVATIQQCEFPFMYTLAIEFGIFKTYGIPTISRVVGATRAVTDPLPAAKRAADTLAIISEFSVNPPTSVRALQAIARMNYLHSKYRAAGQIRNADLLYTLAACVTEPIRFIGRYEWRPLSDLERCAIGVFWMGLGEAMGIEYGPTSETGPWAQGLEKGAHRSWRDGLEFVDAISAWAEEYERAAMGLHPANIPPARRLTAMLLQLVPSALEPFCVEALTVLMSDRMRAAFAYETPGLAACLVTYGAVAVRRFVLRHLTLPRFGVYRVASAQANPATGRVQLNEYLTHPWYNAPTLWNRWGPMALLRRAVGGAVPGDARPADKDDRRGAHREDGRGRGKGGRTYLPEGFLVSDLGPFSFMGVGKEETAVEMERLRTIRTGGCPLG
ncbi:hypothetical protein HMPREF1624_03845 [Sporothrix schenckii ATCC 58251]|uniref:ER-bound oxygenase mpaB/mpaB'/Rubber oxygenase catalytic domain-containing protein n=1 Tax=Sporothrix schenckii (strain ATCC 58251 / de Perez 2211183) TaxID=1391915 RepID=U7PZY5_SPOS1|nr:hypothetical protein HMPREF1624_03845 [Sporothrix schenckii ATCC 58251]